VSSSSSQAKHGLASRRVRKKSKIVEVALLRSVSVNLAELRRVFKMKVALLRSVSVNLAELSPSPRLRRTRRRVFKVKYFRFMDEIVTDGVGHLGG
jgi:hypothetical protein